uniref:Uncharacterized protein n=1 Tax=uncultured Desulfobacterium sp. TaxID=201089 RepID=E1Y8U0_9BACT|nr:unknown protein [uncultured Desulfobacterium sp.]
MLTLIFFENDSLSTLLWNDENLGSNDEIERLFGFIQDEQFII